MVGPMALGCIGPGSKASPTGRPLETLTWMVLEWSWNGLEKHQKSMGNLWLVQQSPDTCYQIVAVSHRGMIIPKYDQICMTSTVIELASRLASGVLTPLEFEYFAVHLGKKMGAAFS